MKACFTCLILLLIIVLSGCREEEALQNEVDQYMAVLKAGAWDDMELPPFSTEAIPHLLSYRHDRAVLSNFLRNPISSFYQGSCTAGLLALWTIESIRLTHQPSAEPLPGRFPSLNPMLGWRIAGQSIAIDAQVAQEAVAQAYHAWWQQSSVVSIYDLVQIDPLAETGYRWR